MQTCNNKVKTIIVVWETNAYAFSACNFIFEIFGDSHREGYTDRELSGDGGQTLAVVRFLGPSLMQGKDFSRDKLMLLFIK